MSLLHRERFRIPLQIIHGGLFFLALGCWFVGIRIYRVTVVEDKTIFSIVLAGMILSVVFLPFIFKRIFSRWLYFVYKVIIGSSFSYGLFLGLNYHFVSEPVSTHQFPIVSTGTLAKGRHGCAQPYALINFEGQPKQLVFDCALSGLMHETSRITLTYSNGLFGFPVISTQQLIR